MFTSLNPLNSKMIRDASNDSVDKRAHIILDKMVELYRQLEQAKSSDDSEAINFIRERLAEERAELGKLKEEDGEFMFLN